MEMVVLDGTPIGWLRLDLPSAGNLKSDLLKGGMELSFHEIRSATIWTADQCAAEPCNDVVSMLAPQIISRPTPTALGDSLAQAMAHWCARVLLGRVYQGTLKSMA